MFHFSVRHHHGGNTGETRRQYLPNNVAFFLLLRPIVTLDGLRLDDYRRVTPLVVLTARRHRPRHVATRQHHTSHNDRHNY